MMIQSRPQRPQLEPDMVVEDPQMESILSVLSQLGGSTIPILLLGETGVGKEVVAAFAHRASGLADRPLIKINCAGLTESVVESELFGHERGAFTGAIQQHKGLLAAAHGGTLFLDELAELPLRTQAKLLRVLETGEYTRVGGNETHRIKVRVIAATHRHLPKLVERGEFRQDLLFRLNGATFEIPPLRERPTEILVLARLFLDRHAEQLGKGKMVLTPTAGEALVSYRWPGNVRELRNAIECATALCAGRCIEAQHLALGRPLHAARSEPPAPSTPPEASGLLGTRAMRSALQAFERSQIIRALTETAGNQTRAAVLLGLSRRTLTNKLNALGIERPRKAMKDGLPTPPAE